jgi:hypothetical protein
MSPLSDVFAAVGSVATAIAVGVAAWQLRISKRQALTQFEDHLAGQYRKIIQGLPVEAMLGEDLQGESYYKVLRTFYHYFDLSNEQAFLHRLGRISDATWDDWKDGILQNVQRPAFRRAWNEISARAPESFDDLRATLSTGVTARDEGIT